MVSLNDIANELARRLISLATKDAHGNRKVMASYPQLQQDTTTQNLVLFHEYYHADSGSGLGAAHQTGWSACVVNLIGGG
jgi:hypothetical protein